METGGGTFDCAFQQKEPAGFQGCDDLQPFLRRQLLRRDPHPFQLPIDGVQSHRICGVAEFFRGGPGGYTIFVLRQRLCQHIGYEQVRVAQLQDTVADGPIAAVVKVDAQQADELAVVLDEKGAGAEILAVDVDAVIIVKKILAQRHPGKVFTIPSNGHFDTTEGNIKQMGSIPRNLYNKELLYEIPEGGSYEKNPFKGNMDIEKLEQLIQAVGPENVPLVFTCITNNPICGQPVSMANIREINRVAHKYDIPLVFDVARWAENCYFIKMNEEGYADKSIAEIASEMFSYCDAFTMSAKKDGHANMGGMLAFRDRGLFWQKFSDFNEDGTVKTDVGVLIKVKQISCYGNDSYGGMSGRDIMALACGLYESCDFGYMHDRVQQCEYLAQGFYKAGVKGVVLPAGGHAVYINMDEFFDGKRDHTTFAGTGFSLELIRRYGIRVSELGDFSMEYDLKTPEQQAELANVVRFAIDRSRLTQEHLDYVIAAVKALYEDRESIPNMRIVWGHKLPMRHFHAFLEPYANEEK